MWSGVEQEKKYSLLVTVLMAVIGLGAFYRPDEGVSYPGLIGFALWTSGVFRFAAVCYRCGHVRKCMTCEKRESEGGEGWQNRR